MEDASMGDEDDTEYEFDTILISKGFDEIRVFNRLVVHSSLEDASNTLYDLLTPFQNILNFADLPNMSENITKIYQLERVNAAIEVLKAGSFASPSHPYDSNLLALNKIHYLKHFSGKDRVYEKAASLMERVCKELKIEQNPSENEQNTLVRSLLSNKECLPEEMIALGTMAADNLEASALPYRVLMDMVDKYAVVHDDLNTKQIIDQTLAFYSDVVKDEILTKNMALVNQLIKIYSCPN